MTLRKFFLTVVALAVLIVAPGCDSDNGNNEPSDADLFVGAFAAVGLSDGSGDQTAAFAAALSRFVATFTANGTYGLDVAFNDERQPIVFQGATYTVDATSKAVTLVLPAAVTGSVDFPLTFGYSFSNSNNTVALVNSDAASVAIIGSIFGASYTSPITLTLQKQ